MYRRIRDTSLLLILSILFIACDYLDRAAQPTGRNPLPAMMVDLELERTIRAKLASDTMLKHADLDVTAQAHKNQATLSGTVSSAQLRDQAIQVARSARLGLIINDRIAVRPAV